MTTHGFRFAGSAAVTLATVTAGTDPLADVARGVATLAAGMVPGVVVAATEVPLPTGTFGSSGTIIDLRLESVSRFNRCNSARMSEAC